MAERPPAERLKATLIVIDGPVKDVTPSPELDAAILAWAEKHFHFDEPITVRRLLEEEL